MPNKYQLVNEMANETLKEITQSGENIVNEKMLELEKNNDEVENPEEFINNLKKYENDVSDFAGFTTSDEKSKEEVTSFSFGNSIEKEESQEDLKKHKKYTRKKETKEVEEKLTENAEESTSGLDTGFLNQMEEQLMRNQQERLKEAKEKDQKNKK